jgi:hypothetical protein
VGTLASPSIAVTPFRLVIDASRGELAAQMAAAPYLPTNNSDLSGWGSIVDNANVINFAPTIPFSVGSAVLVESSDDSAATLPARLRSRYYWHAVRQTRRGTQADGVRRELITLRAADVLIYEERPGSYTGLVTARDDSSFDATIAGLSSLASALDTGHQLTTGTLLEELPEDFFIWLVYRIQNRTNLDDNLYLSSIGEIASKDRNYKGAKFSDTASLQRIELAALIALGQAHFGPAKITVDSVALALGLDVQLFPDGGFQPYRTSGYDSRALRGAEQFIKLIDDAWVHVIPQLRRAHSGDRAWHHSGRTTLRSEALAQVRALLHLDGE